MPKSKFKLVDNESNNILSDLEQTLIDRYSDFQSSFFLDVISKFESLNSFDYWQYVAENGQAKAVRKVMNIRVKRFELIENFNKNFSSKMYSDFYDQNYELFEGLDE